MLTSVYTIIMLSAILTNHIGHSFKSFKSHSSMTMILKMNRSTKQRASNRGNTQLTTMMAADNKSSASTKLAPVRVRFAPSPTGSLHVGGARTALFNWLLARKTKGKFVIRVEDTDEARSTRASETSILNDLKWMNLNWDEGPEIEGPFGPYRQSERKDIYRKYADDLVATGFAYPCFSTDEELDRKRAAAEAAGLDPKYDGTWRDADPAEVTLRLQRNEPHTIRFKVPPGKKVFIDDIVRGRVTWDADASLGDFIILRSNGMPVYNFCVAIDDYSMRITHVIRAEEHLTNTLRQMLILEALGSKPPQYAHCSLILGADRSKLSKRHGATSLKQFSEQGFLPDAMMNYLANLGWNSGTPKEIFTPSELIDAFDLSRIIKSPSMFDFEKLRWVNSQHIRAMKLDVLVPLVINTLTATSSFGTTSAVSTSTSGSTAAAGVEEAILPSAYTATSALVKGSPDELFINLATKIAQRDMELLTEASKYVGSCLKFDFQSSLHTDGDILNVLNEEGFLPVMQHIIADFESGVFPTGKAEEFPGLWKAYIKALGTKLGLKGKALFHPTRLCLTGRMSGPDIGDQLQLLQASAGVISPTYPSISLAKRIEFLKSFDMNNAKEIAKNTIVRLEKEKEEAAAAQAAAATAVAELALVSAGVSDEDDDDSSSATRD